MSGRKCFVCNTKEAAHYFRFPSNPNQRRFWLEFIAGKNNCSVASIPARALLCSSHFNPEDIGIRKLKSGSLPVLDVPCPDAAETYAAIFTSSSDDRPVASSSVHDTSSIPSKSDQQTFITLPCTREQQTVCDKPSTAGSVFDCEQYSSIIEIETGIGVYSEFPFAHLADLDSSLSSMQLENVTCDTVTDSVNVSSDKFALMYLNENMSEHLTVGNQVSIQVDFQDQEKIGSDKASKSDVNIITDDTENFSGFSSSVVHAFNQNSSNLMELEGHIVDHDRNPEVVGQNNVPAHSYTLLETSVSKAPSKRHWKKCSASGCSGSHSNKYVTFPAIQTMGIVNYTNVERCKVWVQNCGNLSLLSVETRLLHSKYFLCNEHFKDDQFYNNDRKTLLPNACPTEFSFCPLTDVQMMQYPVLGIEDTLIRNHLFLPEAADADSGNESTNVEIGAGSNCSNNRLDASQLRFESDMHSLKWITCKKCKEKFFKPFKSNAQCLHSKNMCSMYTQDNDMDPLDVPEELKNLSYVEEQLIARVHPLISVFKLSGHHQYGYRGNIINFPQDVKAFAKCLPHTIDSLSSLITVRTKSEINPVDFHVSADKIRSALMWLKSNNPFYFDVEISDENTARLLQDGNIFDQITCVINVDPSEEVVEDDEELADCDDPDQFNFVKETCVPSFSTPSCIEKAETVLNWPEIGKEAVNEFKTPGYIAMAFPTLFPFGVADLRNPRERKVSPNQYFKHLMQYHDERFARHPRFRYFALNSLMRWNALRNGGVFVKRNSSFQNMNAGQLKEELEKNPAFLKKILFYNSNPRGTRSYWYARGQELLSMVEQLGLPTLFFTLSAADLHWPDLFHHLAPDEDLETMTESRRRKLIEENPLKVDSFFMERGETFITQVLKAKYNVKDLWFRIEYQHRGSPHIHGVLWLADSPKFTDLTKESPEKLQEIAKYFDQYVSTTHPDLDCPKGPIHPCRLQLSEVIDLKKDLAELLNRVQRHTQHIDGYCMRINKRSKKKECRFKFPKDFAEKTEVKPTEDNDVELVTARNDRYLNKYNPFIIQTWRANIDVSPVLSKRALVNYLAKYVTKSETRSEDLKDIVQMLMDKNEADKTVKSIVQQLYIQCCCERDISAQETCHLLMGLPLYSSGGRKFVTINFKVLESDCWVPVPDEEVRSCKSFLEKYMERHERFEEYSLWHMAQNFILPSGRRQCGGKEAIVQVYPKITPTMKYEDPEKYEDQILEKYGSWKEAFDMNETFINATYQPKCPLDDMQPDEPEYQDVDTEQTLTTEQWMSVSRMGPSQTAEKVELGRRDIDVNHDWHAASEKYQQYGGVDVITNFISDKKKNTSTHSEIPQMPDVNFTPEQKSVLDLLKLQIEVLTKGNPSVPVTLPKSVIVQGKAGTGKSLVIHAMKSLICESLGPEALVLLGPTGVSALNITGSTIHSKLHIHPKTREALPLTGNALHEFRQKFAKSFFVLIDEYSMVGCNMLNIIEKRLKEALDRDGEQFGGIFIYFFGDIQQLAPVGDSAAYNNNQVSIDYIDGKLLYESIEASIILSPVKRQSDSSFLNVLNNVSTGNVSQDYYNVLKKRFTTSVSEQERKSFDGAIRLYPTRKEVEDFNQNTLEALKNPTTKEPLPIARIPAHHNCPEAKLGTENEAGGLRSILYLSKRAKIMLRANLWTEQGLVNGAVGTVVDILYADEAKPPEDAPTALVCRFDSYKGPYLDNAEKTVVIKTMSKQWKSKKGIDCVREQFPIALCYACSIHKSQGLTLDKAFVNIGPMKEMSPGLTYTALSRVKSLSGLLLEPFGSKRLLSLNNKNYIKLRVEWIERINRKKINFLIP